jgi:tetratricopeptide (TPR) repeat protein
MPKARDLCRHIAGNAALRAISTPHRRLAIRVATLLVCVFSLSADSTLAQGGADANQAFREATAALREGRLDEAAARFDALTRSSPTLAGAHFNLGLVREEQGRFEEAITSFKKALALDPRLPGANLFLGIAHYRLNQYQPAIAALKLEIKRNSSDVNAWMWLGVVQLAVENPEEAVAALDKAAKLAPDDVDILYNRGRAHLLVSKQSYEKMFQTDPKSWRVHQVIAQADAEADKHDDAIAEYLAAIELVPKQPGLHEELGTEYIKAGKFDEAEAMLQTELEIDPNNILAIYKLGTLEGERGQAAKSKELIEKAVRLNPTLKDSNYYLGRAEMELRNDAAAIDSFKREIAAPGATPEVLQQAWYQLGIVYRNMHRIPEAQQALATFQKLKDQEAERQRQSFEKKRKAQALVGPSSSAPQNP